jgi:hypothetical protein
MEIVIVRTSVTKAALNAMAQQQFGDMVKAVVDIDQGIMAIGGDYTPTRKLSCWSKVRYRKTYGASIFIRNDQLRNGLSSIR